MKPKITRRKVLAAGVASSALLYSSKKHDAEAWSLPDVWGEDFLPQWSPPDRITRDLTPGKSSIRLSCVAWGLRNADGTNPADLVAGIRGAGYSAVEAGNGGWNLLSDSGARELKAALKQHDLLFYNIHVWTNVIHPDPEIRKKNQREVIDAVEKAEQMGIKFILTHTGSMADGKPSIAHRDNWSKKAWEMSVNSLKYILDSTSGSSVALAVEAVNTTSCNSPTSHGRLKQDVGSERIKVTLDPTNMLHPGNVFRTTELLNDCFTMIGEDIMYAHAKDVKWTEMLPGLNWVVPGEGEMDYEAYLTHLSRLKHPRPLMLEFLQKEQYPQAQAFVRKTAKKVGVTIYD